MEKLFELDPYLTHFTACVQSCVQSRKGWDVILDQTAFYPEGGGQPYDLGTLGGTSVLEVHEREGHVVHTCDRPLEPGSQVEGDIDWPRRFDLMQHHSGEHIVSGIAHARYGCENVGFHMGSDVITIDLSVELTQEQVRELEEAANRYIWEDHPIQIAFPSPQELEVLTYRSKKALTGRVRIVSFPGADTCACCGTHVASAGQVGLVKLLSVQKFREGVRVELLCGGRALSYLDRVLGQNRRISNLLSAKPFETAGGVERLLGEYCFPERFREACRACPDYGNDWSCPPGVPSAAEALRPFRTAHVLGMQVFYDAQTRREVSTAEGAEAVRRASYGPAKRVLLETLLALEQTRSGAWTIAAGRCELCTRCARRDGLPCRNPGRMRYSFSAFGFDLAALARQELGIELLWAANGLPEYDVALAAFLER